MKLNRHSNIYLRVRQVNVNVNVNVNQKKKLQGDIYILKKMEL